MKYEIEYYPKNATVNDILKKTVEFNSKDEFKRIIDELGENYYIFSLQVVKRE